MSATIYILDDYRKTPRGRVQHETAIDQYIDQERAKQARYSVETFEAWKREFAKQVEKDR
jgi:hypothetical protein